LLKALYNRAAGSAFLRHNLIFFSGSTLVAFINYLYYPVLGRLMVPADFGEVQTIIAFFMQATVFLQVIGLTTIAALKQYENDPEHRRTVISELEWLALIAGGAVSALLIIFAEPLRQFFQFTSVLPFLLFALTFVVTIPIAFSNAYLQGHRQFGDLAKSNLAGATSKLVLSAGLVMAGLRTVGAIFGLLISQIITLAYSLNKAAKVGRPRVILHRHWPRLSLVKPELNFASVILITSLCINMLLSIDIIFVKHYFSPHDAGLYAGISTIARIIFFLTGPLSAVLIASVKLDDAKHNLALLKRSLTMLFLLGGSTLAFFSLLPQFTIKLLLGSKYLTYADQLPSLSLAIFFLSLTNMLVFYHILQKGRRIAVAAFLGLINMVIMLMLNHNSIDEVVKSMLVGSFILFILITITVNLKRRGGINHRRKQTDAH
jgi:O-antigen/teichoic acid export membrane protein